jgi:hypothetical protein
MLLQVLRERKLVYGAAHEQQTHPKHERDYLGKTPAKIENLHLIEFADSLIVVVVFHLFLLPSYCVEDIRGSSQNNHTV